MWLVRAAISGTSGHEGKADLASGRCQQCRNKTCHQHCVMDDVLWLSGLILFFYISIKNFFYCGKIYTTPNLPFSPSLYSSEALSTFAMILFHLPEEF